MPSLEPQAGGTLVVAGHNQEMLWFDSLPGGGYAARYGVTNKLTKLADDHFLLSDTQGNVTEFLGQGLMFYAQYDAAGPV